MSQVEEQPEGVSATTPSMMDLIHLSRRPLFPPGGVDLYRQIALLTGLEEGREVLDVACGPGVTVEYFVREYGVHGSGVEVDSRLLSEAEDRARDGGLGGDITFQQAPTDDLPFRDEIFDVSIGELGLTAGVEPEDAIRELVRVTKTGGTVVLVQLVWKASVDETRKRVLSEHLGARPLMLVEVKRLLMDAGVGQLHTEDWSDDETAFRPQVKKPFPDFAELFTLSEKLGILRRARKRWGWRGVRTAVAREFEVHRLLTKERILGLDLMKGVKGASAAEGADEGRDEAADEPGRASKNGGSEGAGAADLPADRRETEGLPLFQPSEEDE